MEVKAIVINPKDNVATAISDIKPNEEVLVRIGNEIKKFIVKQEIPFGHKFALNKICKGEKIIKYGETIGVATLDVDVGEHVHIHNVESTRGKAR